MIRCLSLLLAAALYAAPAFAVCQLRPRTVVTLDVVSTVVLAPLTVNGIPGTFILDTGAAQTVVTPEAVGHFNLALDDWTATTTQGLGGTERRRNADPRSVELGGIALHRRSLARDATLRVATIPLIMMEGRRVDGLLGRDFLSAFDLDLNFPDRTLTLYDAHGCSGRFLPWTEDYMSIPMGNPAEYAIVVPVEIDGIPLHALLDSGAGETLIAAPGMARLGLGLDQLRNDPGQIVGGVGQHTLTTWRHRFQVFRVGGETFAAPAFLVAPVQISPVSDMLLGADWLIGRRVWISYSTGQLFATK